MDALARTLIQSAPSAVIALDTEGLVTMLNVRAENLLATSLDDAIGRSYESVFGPSLADRVLSLFVRSSRAGATGVPELVRATLPGGRVAELRASMGPITDADGVLVGVLFVADEAAVSPVVPADQAQVIGRLREALRRYLGDGLAGMVEARPSFIGVGGVRKHVSVLHADVRGYTTVAEMLEPEETVTLLLRYHGKAVEALQREGATLDRFIGDSVLAIWNAPADCSRHARAAIRGALALQAAAAGVGDDLAYGIGVHTGDAVVGNVGNENFLNYTAVGDTVNIAARLQSEAARGEVVCSERALVEAGPGVRYVSLGAVNMKGRREPVQAYRIEGLDPEGSD